MKSTWESQWACNENCIEESHYFCAKGEKCFNNYNIICKLLFALLKFRVYMMQTLMELIETYINKEPNANPSDVSLNASPSVLTVEVITKVPIFNATLDVEEANDSQPKKIKGEQLFSIAKSKGAKNYGGTIFTRGEGDHHYLLLEALLIYA